MKTRTTLLLILLSWIIALPAISQCLPAGITFTSQSEIDNFAENYPGCTQILGDVTIAESTDANITNLEGLSPLITIDGDLLLENNDNLKNLTGLENLKTIGETLEIFLCDSLANFTGLNNLTSIGRSLSVEENLGLSKLDGLEKLTFVGTTIYLVYNPALEDIEGLTNLTTVGEGIQIINNGQLGSLNPLSELTSIGGSLRISGNDALTSLEGIENIDHTTITQLTITYNDMLSLCEVQSVCDYIGVPSNFAVIDGNATGCENQEQVEEACALVAISDIPGNSSATIYPNPSNGIINITGINTDSFEFRIWNSRGFLVRKQQSVKNGQMNLSYLPGGIYTVELRSRQQTVKKKIIIE